MYFKVNHIKIVREKLLSWSVPNKIFRTLLFICYFTSLLAHALYTFINNIYFRFCNKVVRQFVGLGTGGGSLGSTNKSSGDREGYPFVIGSVFGKCHDPGTIPPFYTYLEVVRSSGPCCPIPNCASGNDKLSCTSMNLTIYC